MCQVRLLTQKPQGDFREYQPGPRAKVWVMTKTEMTAFALKIKRFHAFTIAGSSETNPVGSKGSNALGGPGMLSWRMVCGW